MHAKPGRSPGSSPSRRRFDPAELPSAPSLSFEIGLWQKVRYVAGLDEAGRGALAGPVAAGAVILPPEPDVARLLSGVRDSKEMTPAQRAEWAGRIQQVALAWAVGMASAQEIDRLGIVPATQLAACRALEGLTLRPEYLLLDWLALPQARLPQTALVKGDRRCLSIAAASVLAKTSRDALLCEFDQTYPGYGLAAHKGYGSPAHLQILAQRGPCAIHRRSFAPLAGSRWDDRPLPDLAAVVVAKTIKDKGTPK